MGRTERLKVALPVAFGWRFPFATKARSSRGTNGESYYYTMRGGAANELRQRGCAMQARLVANAKRRCRHPIDPASVCARNVQMGRRNGAYTCNSCSRRAGIASSWKLI